MPVVCQFVFSRNTSLQIQPRRARKLTELFLKDNGKKPPCFPAFAAIKTSDFMKTNPFVLVFFQVDWAAASHQVSQSKPCSNLFFWILANWSFLVISYFGFILNPSSDFISEISSLKKTLCHAWFFRDPITNQLTSRRKVQVAEASASKATVLSELDSIF